MNPVLKSAGNLGRAVQQNRRRRRIREYEYEDDDYETPGWVVWGSLGVGFLFLVSYIIIKNS